MTMTKKERLIFLIKTLLKESPEYHNTSIPKGLPEQRMLLRALMNVRAPKPIDEIFYRCKMNIYRKQLKKRE